MFSFDIREMSWLSGGYLQIDHSYSVRACVFGEFAIEGQLVPNAARRSYFGSLVLWDIVRVPALVFRVSEDILRKYVGRLHRRGNLSPRDRA